MGLGKTEKESQSLVSDSQRSRMTTDDKLWEEAISRRALVEILGGEQNMN